MTAYGGAALWQYFACTVVPLYQSPSYISGSHFLLSGQYDADVQFIYSNGKATFNAEVGELAVYGIK